MLQRSIPDALKLSIARKIENNLFSKVYPAVLGCFLSLAVSLCGCFLLNSIASLMCVVNDGIQISFLVGLQRISEIRTLFTAQVDRPSTCAWCMLVV